MNSAKINDWMQVVGIFALVASLVFVGLQMRQDQEIAKATLYQMRSDSGRELGALVIEYSELRSVVFSSMISGTQDLSPNDQLLVNFNCQILLGHFENSHHLYQLGFLSDEQWLADRQQISLFLTGMCQPFWTDQVRATFRSSFVKEIDSLFVN